MSRGSEAYDIAVVSMAGVYPGARDVEAFARLVLEPTDLAMDVPADRWALPVRELVSAGGGPDRTYSARACLLEPMAWDFSGLEVDSRLAKRLDPMFQLVLHVGRRAWIAGRTGTLDRTRVGVALAAIALPTDSSSAISREIVGAACESRVMEKCGRRAPAGGADGRLETHPLNAHVVGLPAGLLASALGLGGGACTLDAACASSLYAIKIACDELSAGRADAMLAGGVSRPECLYTQMGFAQLQALSRRGRCAPFDAEADGLVVGEGCGVLLLKRVEDALAQRDDILGVIRGIGLSNDLAGSLIAADSEGQLRAMRAAYAQAGWQPEDVDYIECHGTGTPLGDSVEFRSLTELWRDARAHGAACAIGSVKSQIGHLLTAAGAAGLQRVLLSMRAGRIPPTANFNRPSDALGMQDSPFAVPVKPQAWTPRSMASPRRAAVSGFGFGGVNAHLLVEEYSPQAQRPARRGAPATSTPVAVIGMSVCRELAHELSMPLGVYRLPPNEIAQTLPQQLAMLEIARAAWVDAGLAPRGEHPRAGAVIGISLDLNTSNYHLRWLMRPWALKWADALGLSLNQGEMDNWVEQLRNGIIAPLNAPRVMGSLGSIAASRVARELGFGGPSLAISATENSGLRALEYAVRALQRHELDQIIVGAVDLADDVRARVCAAQLGLHRSDQGPRANQVVALVLARLDDARRNQQPVRAVVRGVGVASGGRIGAATSGSGSLAVARALADAGRTSYEVRSGHARPALSATATAGLMQIADSLEEAGRRAAEACDDSAPQEPVVIVSSATDGTTCAVVLEAAEACAAPTRGPLIARSCHRAQSESTSASMVHVPIGLTPFEPPLPARLNLPTDGNSGGRAAFESVTSPYCAPNPPVPERMQSPAKLAALSGQICVAGAQVAAAHQQYLATSQSALADIGAGVEKQSRVLQSWLARVRPAPPQAPALDRDLCLEFARGSVARVLGPDFAEVDTYPVRVRLPDEPLMLVDRIVSVEGRKGSLTHGRVVTEHDVRPGAWYLDQGRAPVCIAVEAGQADLFLCSYLGIDLAVRGKRAYRLLDATVEFHEGLPQAPATIRYDIHIDKFVRQNDAYLFFFRFVGMIDRRPVITMTNGCAGFFTAEEIENSGGIVLPAPTADESSRGGGDAMVLGAWPREALPAGWPLPAPARLHAAGASQGAAEAYGDEQIEALRRADLAGCFGDAFARPALSNPPCLPAGRMRLLHRVKELELTGGRWGLGRILAEADIHPDDWYLTCHFVDDQVMPGTLMYECCAHTLRVLLTRMGWLAPRDSFAYEPVPGVRARLKCRGPVTPRTKKVTYEVQIKRLGLRPEPFVIADALMCADGRPIVSFTDMSMQLSGVQFESLVRLWREKPSPRSGSGRAAAQADPAPIGEAPVRCHAKQPLCTKQQILAFSNGNPSACFGEAYRVFDQERRIARLPGPPYQVLDRITEIRGMQAGELRVGGWIEAQYDVPPDAWYFAANRQRSMPFAVLLEVGLQPCGWLAAYLGSALRSTADLHFRNLGGTGTLHAEVFPQAGTLSTRVRMTDVSRAAGMILEKFDLQIWLGPRRVYTGETMFGFFTSESLRNQVGIRDAERRMWRPSQPDCAAGEAIPAFDEGVGSLLLPAARWRMIDKIGAWLPGGGPHGFGYVRGVKIVDPTEWFFAAHFYQDPVCPGSLGLESFLQLLKYAALRRWGAGLARTHRFEPIEAGRVHRWTYRGQIVPSDREIRVEALVTHIEDAPIPTLRANGFLSVDGRAIYEITDFGMRLVPNA